MVDKLHASSEGLSLLVLKSTKQAGQNNFSGMMNLFLSSVGEPKQVKHLAY